MRHVSTIVHHRWFVPTLWFLIAFATAAVVSR
jgi:hypothetical protein